MRLWPLLLVSICVASCLPKKHEVSKIREVDSKPSALCDGTPLVDFMLTPNKNSYDSAKFDWPPLSPGEKRVAAPATAKEGVHLQLCMNEDYSQVTKLLRAGLRAYVMHGEQKILDTFTIIPSKPPVMEGLTDALFGDLSKLRVEAEDENGAVKFFMKGWPNDGNSVASAEVHYIEYFEGEEFKVPTKTLIGTLTMGNPFSDYTAECGLDEYLKQKYILGTAVIRTKECRSRQLIGDLQLAHYLEIQVEDSNAALPGGKLSRILKGTEVDLSLPAEKRLFDFKYYHHGGSPWFYINLPEASYGMLSEVIGSGSGEPPPFFMENGKAIYGKYRVRYGSNAPNESVKLPHFLWQATEDYTDSDKAGSSTPNPVITTAPTSSSTFPKACTTKASDNESNARTTPNGKLIAPLSNGSKVIATKEENNWYAVEFTHNGVEYGEAKNKPAWISKSLLICK